MASELPFDSYPGQGRKLLGAVKGSNCRAGYGAKFIEITRERQCAYCSRDLLAQYELWLTMVLDHVIPVSVCENAGIPTNLTLDMSNMVLACAACNGFHNRYALPEAFGPLTPESFYDVRDKIFRDRRRQIEERHRIELQIYEKQLAKIQGGIQSISAL